MCSLHSVCKTSSVTVLLINEKKTGGNYQNLIKKFQNI